MIALPFRGRLTQQTGTAPPQTATTAQARPGSAAPVAAPDTPNRYVLLPLLHSTGTAPSVAASASPATSLEDVISRATPAVASIITNTARGTGFFVRPDTLLTNAHVIDGQSSVRLWVNGMEHTARVTSVSTSTDVAILQVADANPAQATLPLGSVGEARVGEEVVAIGFALGSLSNTVTRGIVSAVRKVGDVMLIQTDAAINPGNSGGPLIDRAGQVLGITSIGFRGQEGLAFAIAADHATQLLQGRTLVSGSTPLAALNQAMSTQSESDQLRATGERAYGAALQQIARGADQLDAYWNRYAATCVASASSAGDRAWFAVLEPNGVRINGGSEYNCGSWMDTLQQNASVLRGQVAQATEIARRDGVYPGVMRDLRRNYRLEWDGWER